MSQWVQTTRSFVPFCYRQEDLYQILKAYTIHNPAEGYCQAQAPVAAILLMHMPAEQAFWCLVAICEKYLPGYYAPGLEAVQVDGDVLFGLLKKTSHPCYKHLVSWEYLIVIVFIPGKWI